MTNSSTNRLASRIQTPKCDATMPAPMPASCFRAVSGSTDLPGFHFDGIAVHAPRSTPPIPAAGAPALAAQQALSALRLAPANVTTLTRRSTAASRVNPFLPAIRTPVHQDAAGDLVADAFGAEAVTIHGAIFAHRTTPSHILHHELAHAAQMHGHSTPATPTELEAEAVNLTRPQSMHLATPGVRLSAVPSLPLHHPAIRTLQRAGAWLARRTTDTLSKHVARHGRRIVGRAVHSIFRDPTKIKTLVSRAVTEASALARRHATKSATEVLEEGGVKIMQQASRTPGKVRTVIEKDFGREIGTRGEKILRVVLDQSGRVVTAFPVDSFLAVGLGFVAVDVFTAKTAEAAENVRSEIEAHKNRPTNWGEVAIELVLDIASFGLLASSTANEGEDMLLRIDRIIEQATKDTIREIEAQEGVTLTTEQKDAIRSLVAVAVGAPMEFEEIREEAHAVEPSPRFIRSPDGSMIDTSTYRMTLGPGPKF